MTAPAVLADRDPGQALHNGKPPFEPNASKMGLPPICGAKRLQNSIILAGCAIQWPRVQLSIGSSAIVAASHNLLNINENLSNGRVRHGLPCHSGRGHELCVFFAQHSFEKRPWDLWEGRLFIAPQTSFDNVCGATEGGIPVSRFPG
jgi:hypothetical protein